MKFFLLSLLFASAAFAQTQISSSALIGQALDEQVSDLNVQGGLQDVMKAVETQTGVRIEATPLVWDALPWGQETSLSVHVKNSTVRAALENITRRLGLTFTLGPEAVVLQPSPPLRRLGRRSTLDEIRVLDQLAATPLNLATEHVAIQQLLDAVDDKLAGLKSPFAIQDRAFDATTQSKRIHIAPNATLMDALEELSNQTNATWYPWGHSLLVTGKVQAIRLLLSKRFSRQFRDEELGQVLLDLAQISDVSFRFDPGVLQKVPESYHRITGQLQDATVEQALQWISGKTGLRFTPTADGVNVTLQP